MTRAAERLHLSQSSVSVHLAKLRAALDDPLLLPGPRGMRPTARAEALRAPLRQALEALQRAVAAKAPFVPAQAGNRWRVAATDYDESTILLPALAALRSAAPGMRLAVLEMAPLQIARQAERGQIDLALHTRDGAPPNLRHPRCSPNAALARARAPRSGASLVARAYRCFGLKAALQPFPVFYMMRKRLRMALGQRSRWAVCRG
ncbi:LysR family transcriptional regulator [Xanthomonas translucens]|uniref:LysR family transcriptional regulator n=1 Tax=Xanthomonas campestris pv. translucens TaxID=343 RepID=UPI001E3B2FA2|nr:LysR family transcriptional regulator [Xanthomonas translucens]MCS3358817.1 LysR family transcriptional regulator [Xanthomonas translucens pv. translucens]MCS3372986.1 LysR family transcriptional regulator [Xanthomonas translucens pv. translucens]MCT8288190.1 LysR family transcriptional regulator [Xanthomonas translucens pv. translucens]MCT8291975.1 LysR family transcriptional regulator [Xanthomonas translucens pv. translucens]MCT8319377.1 LysR family transcriptional regulator [Xanthomonas 